MNSNDALSPANRIEANRIEAAVSPADAFRRCVASRTSHPAWLDADPEPVSWISLGWAVAETADALACRRVAAGDRVVTSLANGWQAVVIALAIQLLDAIESPIDPRHGAHRADDVSNQLDARLKIDAGLARQLVPLPDICRQHRVLAIVADRLREYRQIRAVDQPAWILWTSGTTAAPKGAMLSKYAVVTNARAKLAAVPQTSADRRLTVLPLSHAYARTCDFLTWLCSGSTLAAGVGWQAIEELAPRVRPTLINAVPFLIDRLFTENSDYPIASGGDQPSPAQSRARLQRLGLEELRVLGCGGAALSPAQFGRIRELGIVPIQGYGLTESGPVICSATPEQTRPGSVGPAVEHTAVRLTSTGELEARGPGIMLGYWKDPTATAARFTPDGWLKTGDLAVEDGHGGYRILGRKDDVIVFPNGKKLFPTSIERALTERTAYAHLVIEPVGTTVRLRTSADASEKKLLQITQAYEALRTAQPSLPSCVGIVRDTATWSQAGGQLTAKGTVRRAFVLSQPLETQ